MAFKLDFNKLRRPKTEEERAAEEQARRVSDRAADAAKRDELSTKTIRITVSEVSGQSTFNGDRIVAIWGKDDKGRDTRAQFYLPDCYDSDVRERVLDSLAESKALTMHGYWKPYRNDAGKTFFTFRAQKIDGISLEQTPARPEPGAASIEILVDRADIEAALNSLRSSKETSAPAAIVLARFEQAIAQPEWARDQFSTFRQTGNLIHGRDALTHLTETFPNAQLLKVSLDAIRARDMLANAGSDLSDAYRATMDASARKRAAAERTAETSGLSR